MDKDHITKLIEIGVSQEGLATAQKTAARALADAGERPFPHNACAATLSALLKQSGIDVRMTLGAGDLAHLLKGRGWERIAVGKQSPGDVGVTYDLKHDIHGPDHIYLVVQVVDEDEMIIADNQAASIHRRFASGNGKTPTEYFLRAT